MTCRSRGEEARAIGRLVHVLHSSVSPNPRSACVCVCHDGGETGFNQQMYKNFPRFPYERDSVQVGININISQSQLNARRKRVHEGLVLESV